MVINNKKGTEITNPMTILVIIIIFGMLTFGFFKFSLDLTFNSNNQLSDDSIVFIAENNGFKVNDKNFSQNILTDEELQSSFYVQDDNSTTSDKDDSLEFLYYRGQSVGWRGLTNSLYNMPAYVVRTLGLDISEWFYVVNALNLLIWGIIFFVIYKIVRGLIR